MKRIVEEMIAAFNSILCERGQTTLLPHEEDQLALGILDVYDAGLMYAYQDIQDRMNIAFNAAWRVDQEVPGLGEDHHE